MTERLLGLGLNVGMKTAQLGLRAARLPLDVIGMLRGGGHDDEPTFQPPAREEAVEDVRRPAAASRPAPVRERPPATTPSPTPTASPADAATPVAIDGGAVSADEPVHVSEEPTLVGEFAEEGAEDGAHAEIDVSEPWDGYARMTVRDIEQRLAQATSEEAAVVQLYESTHKKRQSVLKAATRRGNQQAAKRRRSS